MLNRTAPFAGLVALVLLYPSLACAAELGDFAGTWVMRIGQRNLFVLTLKPAGNQLNGTFDRPKHISSAGNMFSNMSGGVSHDTVVKASFKDGVLHITVRDASDPKDEDTYMMALNGNRAELSYENLPPGIVLEPRIFERVAAGAVVSTDWEPNRVYLPGDSDTPSAAMKAIFDEDQRVRQSGQVDWAVVGKTDAERREQTRKLLADGALHTGKDFEEAAFVFQHGGKPDDYLLAHTLAMVAISKGDPTAIWIAAATLDRYLENIKQKQILGTQFNNDNGNWTQEPYDRTLISDFLRRQLGVPSQASQTEQLQAYQDGK